MEEALKRIAGPYEHTKSGVLGEKRYSMLTNELHLKAHTGERKPRAYECWPGTMYPYGLPNPPKTESVSMAMMGWPGSELCHEDATGGHEMERDFKALNRGAVDMGMVKAPEFRSYRSMYDARRQSHNNGSGARSLRHAPLIFPKGMTFGIATRPGTPIFELIENRYGKCWMQQIINRYVEEEKKHAKKVPKGSYSETYTSRLRKHREPVDPKPLWHMPKFAKNAQPHLDTFPTKKEKLQTEESNILESVPRKGQFEVHRSGIQEPAKR